MFYPSDKLEFEIMNFKIVEERQHCNVEKW